tara:strand:- start:263 stop:502 length:240 start_codon:yes stop_codon:yes gene_type:complete
MASIISQSKIVIELEADEIEAFALLISEVRNAYDPPQAVGFQMKPKFQVPDNVGELSLKLYPLIFGEQEVELEQEEQDY